MHLYVIIRGGSRGVSEVSGNQSHSNRDTLIKQSQYSEQQCSKFIAINKDFMYFIVIVSKGQLFSADSYLFFFFFWSSPKNLAMLLVRNQSPKSWSCL